MKFQRTLTTFVEYVCESENMTNFEFGSSTNVTTRQDLCLDSWWTRPGCSVKKIIGQNWTQVCEFEGQSGEVHIKSLPFYSHLLLLCHQPGKSCDVFRHAKLSGVDGISMIV